MRKSLTVLFFAILLIFSKAQNYGYSWHATNYGWLGSNGTLTKIHDDEKGNVYTATQGFLSTPQLYIQKKDITNGTPLYNITIEDPGSGFTYPWCKVIKSDDSGNLYVSGNMNGSPTVLNFNSSGSYTLGTSGSSDFIAKYSPTGTILYAFLTKESISDLAFDSQGNIYTIGSFTGSVDVDWSTNTNTVTSNGGVDIFIAKYSSNGQFIRAYNIGSTNTEYGTNIINDGSDKFIIAGTFSNTTVDFDPKATTYMLTSLGSSDLFLARYDSTFKFNWANNIGGTGAESLYKMEKENKKINIIAYFNSPTMDVDLGASTLNLSSSGPAMHGFISYDTSRILQFGYALNFNSFPSGVLADLDLNTSGNVAAVGSYTAPFDANIGPGVATMTMVPPTSTCCASDLYLAVYNSTGYQIAYAFGSAPDAGNRAQCVIFNSNNEIIMGGTDYSINTYKFDFDPSTGIAWAPPSSGFNHGFVAKYGYCTTAPIGTISAIIGPTVVCANSSFQTYSIAPVSGASNYNWISSPSLPGSGSINSYYVFSYSGSGTIQVQPINACGTSTIIQTLSITVNPQPTVTAVSSNTMLCSGQSSTLIANGALTYSWSTSASGSFTAVSPTVNTTYTVTGTDANGCSDTDTLTQFVSACTGIASLSKEPMEKIQAFPNPFNDKLSIVMYIPLDCQFQIYNMLGSVIYSGRIEKGKAEIDLFYLPAGIYFIKVGSVTKKIIKQ